MIRGAIAFGLVLSVDGNSPNKLVIVSTTLFIVCFTTIVYGMLMPLVQKNLIPPREEEKHEYDNLK